MYNLDVSDRTKKKNGLTYLSWASAWAELKKQDPNATFKVHKDENTGNFWFSSPESGCWTEVSVTAFGITYPALLPIMDFKNKSIPAEKVDVMEANRCMQRCFTKACAYHGVGLKIYENEDNMPGMVAKRNKRTTVQHEPVSKELEAARKAILNYCRERVSTGTQKDKLYKVIMENNNGDKNPSKIATVEKCNEILELLRSVE